MEEVADLIRKLVHNRMSWAEAAAKYPKFVSQDA